MQYVRAQNILSGQSNLARRVFTAVPMQEFWDVQQISTELFRLESHNLTKAEITGCLRTLVDAGLVNETASLTFRSTVKPPKETAVMMEPKKQQPSLPQDSLMDRMNDKADALRSLADDIDLLAMELDEALKAASADSEKLKQFQSNLKLMMG